MQKEMALTSLIKTELLSLGASLVGVADLTGLPPAIRKGYDYGISIGVSLNPAIINGIALGPTRDFFDEVNRLNDLLDSLDLRAAEIIEAHGFKALPKTRPSVGINYSDHSTELPHKTVATKSGLGWIGKCAVLVTESLGSALRISSVLTDAPLVADKPIETSKCGSCDLCVRNCPAGALSGESWQAGVERSNLLDMLTCRKKAVERAWKVSSGETHCGLCLLVCPWTKRYIANAQVSYGFPAVDMATKEDLPEILALQRLAFQESAARYDDYSIKPLKQTLEELMEESKESFIMKVVEDRRIIGSVRGFEKDGTAYIGKVIVHPEYQNRGIGKKLMAAMEKCFSGLRCELFTGHLDEKNLVFYEKLGYRRYKTMKINERMSMVYLEKQHA